MQFDDRQNPPVESPTAADGNATSLPNKDEKAPPAPSTPRGPRPPTQNPKTPTTVTTSTGLESIGNLQRALVDRVTLVPRGSKVQISAFEALSNPTNGFRLKLETSQGVTISRKFNFSLGNLKVNSPVNTSPAMPADADGSSIVRGALEAGPPLTKPVLAGEFKAFGGVGSGRVLYGDVDHRQELPKGRTSYLGAIFKFSNLNFCVGDKSPRGAFKLGPHDPAVAVQVDSKKGYGRGTELGIRIPMLSFLGSVLSFDINRHDGHGRPGDTDLRLTLLPGRLGKLFGSGGKTSVSPTDDKKN